jgi:hypothetical protein
MDKGQIFTWDMIFGTTLFMAILLMVAYLWDSTVSEIQDAEVIYDIGWHATMLSETLVRTPGAPEQWETTITGGPVVWDYSKVLMFGFADNQQLMGSRNIQDRLTDPDKVLWFIRMVSEDYELARAMVLRTGKYDFYVQFKCRETGVECFRHLYVPTIRNGVITCNNGFRFDVINNWTYVTLGGPYGSPVDYCIVGLYTTPSAAGFITSSTKNAVFNEPVNVSEFSWFNQRSFDKAIEVKVVTYMKPGFT